MERLKSVKAQKLSCTYVRFVLQPFTVGGPWETNGPPSRLEERPPLDDYGLASVAEARSVAHPPWRQHERGAGRELLPSRAEELLHEVRSCGAPLRDGTDFFEGVWPHLSSRKE
jgi:hypothetical protein